LNNDVNVPSRIKSKNTKEIKLFFVQVADEKSRIRSKIRIQKHYGSADLDPNPDPYQNVEDP
jgi:hypothetical protein